MNTEYLNRIPNPESRISNWSGCTNQELPPFDKFVTEVLIFRSSRSQMFSKIGILKNFLILESLFNKVAGLLLQSTYGDCFWIFAAANNFLQLNLVLTAASQTGFCSGLL